MSIDIFNHIARFFLLLILQVLILSNIQLGGYLNPYAYVLFILLLPVNTPKLLLLFLAFAMGISVDWFSNTMGMHAAASVFMAYMRPAVIKILTPRERYEPDFKPDTQHMGLKWFLPYTLILVLLHHFLLFYIEVFRFQEFISTFIRVILSSILTIIIIILVEYMFTKPARKQ